MQIVCQLKIGRVLNVGLLLDIVQEAPGSVFDEVGDKFESSRSTVVGIGDFGMMVTGAKVCEASYFHFLIPVDGKGENVLMIGPVHGEDEVEFSEVRGREAPGRSGDGVVAFAEGARHAGVGLFPGVYGKGAGGVAGDLVGKPGLPDEVTKDVVGGGGATDVAETHEENFVRAFHGGDGRKKSSTATAKE